MNRGIVTEDTGGNGTPVVLVHGDWTDSGIWAPVKRRLGDRFRMISYDQRGYGASPAAESPYTWLGDLQQVLDGARVTRAVFAGHSGGAGAAVSLALAEPERVAALILIAPGTEDYPWPEDDLYLRECGRLIQSRDVGGLTELGLRTWAQAGHDAAIRDQLGAAVRAWFRGGAHRRPDPPAYPALHEITASTAVVVGDMEYPMVARSTSEIAARIGGARTFVIPGADHLLPARAPGELAGIIAEYATTG